MYTFQPIPDEPVTHVGFAIICMALAIPLIVTLFNDYDEFLRVFFLSSMVIAPAYYVSYHYCDQNPTVYANVPVTAEFAGYAPEGYREKSGKTYVDRHFVYVVYTVNGDPVLLRAETGVTYPKTATLYRN